MASALCRGCLTGLRGTSSRTVPPVPASIASFHSSSALQKGPPVKNNPRAKPPGWREKTNNIFVKSKRERPKPPPIGERKAMRKRIVLSNTNAFEVSEMKDLSAENMFDAKLRGEVVGLPGPVIDQLRAAEAFKTTQSWKLFRRPAVLMRQDTIELGRLLESLEQEKGKVVRKLVTGRKGTGKSLLLMQAMAMGFLKNWIVVPVTECQHLTVGSSSYAPVDDTKPTQYVQKQATAALLSRIHNANKEVLSKLTLSQEYPDFPTPLQANMSLDRLASIGVQTPEFAWSVFNVLWNELTATAPPADSPKAKDFVARPPLLLIADNVGYWMKDTEYRAVDSKPVHAHDLLLVRHFLDLFSNSKAKLPNGAAMLYATACSNAPKVPSLDIALKQRSARNSGISPASSEYPLPPAYFPIDDRVIKFFESDAKIEIQDLGGLTKPESRGLMEYMAKSGVLRERVSEEWLGEKWSLAGGGIIGELQKLGTRLRL